MSCWRNKREACKSCNRGLFIKARRRALTRVWRLGFRVWRLGFRLCDGRIGILRTEG